MFMPNDFGNGGGAPQGMGGPFDLQAQLAALPPEIRAQVMARMGIPGGGMQAGLPDQGMNQTGPMPPQGGMRPGLPGQGAQSGPMRGGGNSAIDPRTGQPWDRNIGPTARSRVLSQQQPTAASGSAIPGSAAQGSGPMAGGRGPMGPGAMTPEQQMYMQNYNDPGGQIFGGGPSGRSGNGMPPGMGASIESGKDPVGQGIMPGGMMGMPSRGGAMPISDVPQNIRDLWANGGRSPFGDGQAGGQLGGPQMRPGYNGPADSMGLLNMDPAKPGGNTLHTMPAPAPAPAGGPSVMPMPAIVNKGRNYMSPDERAAAIAADKAMVGGAPPYVGKPKPMGQTDPPVTGTANDVKPYVGKPKPAPMPAPTPQQGGPGGLQSPGGTKPKPKPKPPTLGRNYK